MKDRPWLWVLLLAANLLSCGGKGTESKPIHYNVYLEGYENDVLYVLDLDSLNIIDSILNLGPVASLAVSPDGRWIYAQSHDRPSSPALRKVDARTGEVVGVLPDNILSSIHLFDDGALILRGSDLCRRDVIDASGPVITRTLDDSICAMRGPVSGTRVAALVNGSTRIRVLDVSTNQLSGEYIAHRQSGPTIGVVDAYLHPDGVLVAALGTSAGNTSWFVIGSTETGETLLQYLLSYPQGQVAISEDGLWAAVTDPSNVGRWETHPTVDIFDLEQMTHVKRFSTETGELEGNTGQLCFLPGYSKILVVPRYREGPIHLIDLETLSVERVAWLPFSDFGIGGLAVGRRP